MKDHKCFSRISLILIFSFNAVVFFAGCSNGKEKSIVSTVNSSSDTISNNENKPENTIMKKESSVESRETNNNEVNTENEDADMKKDEIITRLDQSLGIDFSDYISSADGVTNGSRYYINLTVLEGEEEKVEELIVGLCGEGAKASSRKRPILNNRLAEEFDKAELITVYDYLRKGTDGAKTVSTTIYIAKSAGKENVYFFGA